MAFNFDVTKQLNVGYVEQYHPSHTYDYVTTYNGAKAFADYVYTPSNNFFTYATQLFGSTNLSNMIKSIRWYPFDLTSYLELTDFSDYWTRDVAGKPMREVFGSYNVKYIEPAQYNNLVDIADFDVPLFEDIPSYLSIEPYTTIKLYLPFYNGLVDIDARRVSGKKLYVYGVIDFIEGDMIYVICTDSNEYITSVKTHITIDIPIYATDMTEYAKKMNNSLSGIIKSASQLDLGGAINNFIEGQTNKYNISQITSGSTDSVMGAYAPMTPTLLIYRPKPKYHLNDTKYNHMYGVPTKKIGKIKNFGGFTKVKELHSYSFSGATQQEINEIERLLKQGIRAGNSQATLSITYNASHITWSSSPSSIGYGQAYTTTFAVASGYQTDNVQVLMGGVDITNTAVSGSQISISSVTGNIIINIATSKIPVYYTITHTNLTGATLSNTATQVLEGTSYSTFIVPQYNLGYYKGSFTPTITMGGVTISNVYVDGQIYIPNVQGNIVITGTLSQSSNLNADTWTPRNPTITTFSADEPILNLTGEMYKDSTQCEFTDLTIDTSEDVSLNNSFVYGTANISGVGSNIYTGLNTQLTISYESGQTYVELGRLTRLHLTTNSAWTNYANLLEWLDNNFDKVV